MRTTTRPHHPCPPRPLPTRRAFCLFAAAGGLVLPAQARPGRYGPFATARRAQEVAQHFVRAGYRAVFFHNGDGYYVDVRR